MKKLVVILMALFTGTLHIAQAQKPGVVLSNDPGWQKIGETVASFKSQDESIAVIGADEFAAIKIKVKDAPLKIDRLQVFYESGDMEEIDVSEEMDANEESDVFMLENPERDIQKVAFTYNTVPNTEGDKADVELYGLKKEQLDRSSDAYREELEKDAKKTEEDIERAAENTEEDIERGAEETESDFERGARKAGDAISEAASKTAAEITDKRHDTKVGPDDQTIYIEDDGKYYYVNDEGKKVYVSEIQLKDKPDKD